MGSAAAKILGYFERFSESAAHYPLLTALLIVCILPPSIWCVIALWRRRPAQALWATVAIIIVLVCFSWGDDTYTHTYRVVAVSEQIREFTASLLLTNSQTGVVVPTFVYYSPLPYLVPVILNLIGVPALVAFKFSMCLQLVVMALGVQRIVEKTGTRAIGFYAAILLVTANYTYEVWVSRAALAELWVYSVVPWVISNSLPSRTPTRNSAISLTLVFFVQAVAHPIVLAHSLLCEVPAVMGLARIGPIELALRWFVPFIAALVLAIPFWLPQALWQSYILGPAALPADFGDSFQTAVELLDPKNNRNMSTFLPIALVLMLAMLRLRLSVATWFLTVCWAVLLALQSVYLRHITLHIPTLPLSLFVWRLMLPTAMLAFAALLSGWRDVAGSPVAQTPRARRGRLTLAWLAGISAIFMAGFTVLESVDYLRPLATAQKDHDARVAYDTDKENSIWGVREYIPNYESLKQTCFAASVAEVRQTRYDELRNGLSAGKPYLAITRAPIGMVTYRDDGKAVQPSFCGEDLVIGPLPPNATVTVDESALHWLLAVRGVEMALLVLFFASFLFGEGRRRGRLAAA
jgi:hypothetical protein